MENSKSKSKSKTTVKAKKPAASTKASATKKATAKSILNEDDIRAKAQEIYNDRISKGVSGTPEEDWLKAEQQLKR